MENNETNDVQVEETKTPTFDEILASNKDYQSEFDRRLAKSNKTYLENEKVNWEKEYTERLEREKSEAEKLAKMNTEQQLQYKIDQLEAQIAESNNKLNDKKVNNVHVFTSLFRPKDFFETLAIILHIKILILKYNSQSINTATKYSPIYGILSKPIQSSAFHLYFISESGKYFFAKSSKNSNPLLSVFSPVLCPFPTIKI